MIGRRIGLLRVGSLGDHLIALPLYRGLKELHERDTLVLISNIPAAGNRKLAGASSILPPALFDEFHHYPVGSSWSEAVEKYRLFRTIRLDGLYYLMPRRSKPQLRRDWLFFRVAGIPVVGLGELLAAEVRPSTREIDFRDGTTTAEHEAERLARAIPALRGMVKRTPRYLSLDLSDAERTQARALNVTHAKCTVVLSVGTKCDVNHWGVDKWSGLVRRLSALPQIDRLVLIGAADERAESESLGHLWPRRWDNLCGRLSPRQSAAVIAEAQLFVGHDSGPMHMAAAVGVPIVAIFSSRNLPGAWFPLSENKRIHYTAIDCMGCGRVRCEDRHKACINLITVDEVFASCDAALAESPWSSVTPSADAEPSGDFPRPARHLESRALR